MFGNVSAYRHRIEIENAFYRGAKFGSQSGRYDLLVKLDAGLRKDYGIGLTPQKLNEWGIGVKEEEEAT